MTLSEKYRPKSLNDMVGQDKAVATIRRLLSATHYGDGAGFGGRAYLVTGLSGTGKTSLARIMASLSK